MRLLASLLGGLVLGACVQSGEPPAAPGQTWSDGGSCEDRDLDGFGEGCANGGDCNDLDKNVHVGCGRCAVPQQGCACDEGDKPVSCFLSPSSVDGTVMCHEGTRYCRSGQWSACESLVTYARDEVFEQSALISPGSVTRCSDCSVNCFMVRDNLDPVDAGLDATSSNVSSGGDGLTLTYTTPDAGAWDAGLIQFDPNKCVLGSAPDRDCDGLPDRYDPYPDEKPFATANPTLFLDIGPGQTGTGVVNLQFYLNSADIYFLVDQSGSMGEERDKLKADLVSGDFIQDASRECSDYDFDFKPNNELKGQGIIGAVRCIIRDANFGVGYFREIPFKDYAETNSVTFSNLQDITNNISSVITGVGKLTTLFNIDWPEAATLALNNVITGRGYYFGSSRPAVAARTNCPSLTYGYPCFRNSAIPIIVMFTDAPMHEGPSPNTLAYDRRDLTFTNNTPTSVTVDNTNEAYETARVITADLTAGAVRFSGNNSSMRTDFGSAAMTCGSSDPTAPDAMYKFTLPYAATLKATTSGIDTTVAFFKGELTGTPAVLPSYPNTNDTVASAYDFGTIDSKYVQASGNSSSLTSDYFASDISCGAAADAKDATFKFKISERTRVALDATGSSYGASLALVSGTPVTAAAISYTAVDNNNDTFATSYAAGDIKGQHKGWSGNTSAATLTTHYTAAQLACPSAATPADAAPDAVYGFSLSQATRVRISTEGSSFPTVIALVDGTGVYPTATAISPNNNEAQTSAKDIGEINDKAYAFTGSTSSMAANHTTSSLFSCNTNRSSVDAVFKFSVTGSGTRTIIIDTIGSGYNTTLNLYKTSVTSSNRVTCDDNSGGNNTSRISTSLGSGTYYIVIKGATSSAKGAYTLNIRDTSVTLTSTYQCDYNSGPSGRSLIEADLAAGSYRVVVKGKAATDKGAYKLILRDLNAVPTGRIACDSLSGGTGAYLERELDPGTYHVVLKGSATSGAGDYKLSIRDASKVNINNTAVACGTGASGVTATLEPGTYYAAVKGYDRTDVGSYTLTLGPSGFIPPTWDETLAALNAKSAHVITVLSCRDDSDHGDRQGDCKIARNQAIAIANGTDTLGTNKNPLYFDIDGDGKGLSTNLISGISQLAHYLEMDVSVRVVFDPDPNPGFGLELVAVDAAGDGCSGLVGTTHKGCAPGASPRFDLRFTNPNPGVPPNPATSNGGYNFRAELIGDDQFIVDQVPIYIVPENVTAPPAPVPQVAASGSYWQTLTAGSCTGTLRPDWRDLSWSANVPDGTKISFGLCASDNAADLATCTPTALCTITGGKACTSDSQCTNGFCSTEKNCQTVTAGSCTLDTDCATGASCRGGKCTYFSQPVYVGGVLGTANYTSNLRMQIDLTANTTANTAPTVRDWSLSYLCNSAL